MLIKNCHLSSKIKIVVIVAKLCKATELYSFRVTFMVHELYLNKLIFKNKKTGLGIRLYSSL